MEELAEIDIQELVLKTTCAGALGIVAAEGFRAIFNRWILGQPTSRLQKWLHDCTHAAISAFILVVVSYEKALFLSTGMEGTFYIYTFFLCILCFRIFSSSSPSPCFPLMRDWNYIKQAGIVLDKNKKQMKSFNLTSVFRMVAAYLRVAIPFLVGLCLGLFVAVSWLKLYWSFDGWVSSHHTSSLPFLDKCIDCLQTSVWMAFFIETALTYAFLVYFEFVDKFTLPREGTSKLQSIVLKNCLNSGMIVILMYIFINITGCFANPFHALFIQRHCMSDLAMTSKILLVYVIGPFVGTIAFLLLNQDESNKKAKNSV